MSQKRLSFGPEMLKADLEKLVQSLEEGNLEAAEPLAGLLNTDLLESSATPRPAYKGHVPGPNPFARIYTEVAVFMHTVSVNIQRGNRDAALDSARSAWTAFESSPWYPKN